MVSALAADHVLRRNLRVINRSTNYSPTPSVQSLFGSHYISLQDRITRLWNAFVDQLPESKAKELPRQPVLDGVASNERFGRVHSEHAATFGGLFLKEEPEDDLAATLLLADADQQDEICRDLNIDPRLAHVPVRAATSVEAKSVEQTESAAPSLKLEDTDSAAITPLPVLHTEADVL